MSDQSTSPEFRPTASLGTLARRSALLRRLREFFHARGFVEVETPLVAAEVIPELHIEPIATADGRFLQASPELHMKRLLAAGAEAIFQVTRSFRSGERGPWHNGEFTIVEWYRRGDGLVAGMDLLDELARDLLNTPPAVRTTYADAFRQHVGVNPLTATMDELAAAAEVVGVAVPAGLDRGDRDEWLNLLLAMRVEPQLDRERPEILYHYPASQASLAKVATTDDGMPVAERFELYWRGVELANGFHELTDAAELRRRFDSVNAARRADGRDELPLPERLLAAMEHGLPECAGCALGFDRLVMLAVGAASIDEVIAFPEERA